MNFRKNGAASKGKKVLTISVAAYNIENYIERCLKSLVIDEKHMKKMEVLIENDGSTDKTAKVAQKYVDKYPDTFVLINKKNGGYGSTVNNSIKLARGKYFKLLDGDDEYKTQNLPEFLDILEKIDSDMVCSPRIRFIENNNHEEILDPFSKNIVGEKDVAVMGSDEFNVSEFHMFVAAYKTEAIRKTKIVLPEHSLYTDSILTFCPITQTDSIFVTHSPIYVYHVGRSGQSTSVENLIRHGEESGKIINYLLDFGDTCNKNKKFFSQCFGRNCGALYIGSYKLILPVSRKVLREIKDFDLMVKDRNIDAWQAMGGYKVFRLLRNTRYSWFFYVALHFWRKAKLKGNE